jgi:hypothetical protein
MQKADSLSTRVLKAAERFYQKVEKAGINHCWMWTGARLNNGYGSFRYIGKNTTAHRASYQLHKGEIPTGLHVDHICRVRLCVNPNHLRAVTQRINNLENCRTISSVSFKKTHCNKGHALSGENLLYHKGRREFPYRQCRRCKNNEQNLRRRKERSKALAALEAEVSRMEGE